MKKGCYSDVNLDDLILRDHLASDRTMLANERTLLAYIRTSLTLLAAGVTVAKFFGAKPFYYYAGWTLCILGVVFLIWGIFSFRKMHLELRKIKAKD
jgi:putative membrane protein